MPPLHQQRAVLLDANTKLVREWLRVLQPEGQLDLLKSMLRKFSINELAVMKTHVGAEVAKLKPNA